MKLFRTDDDFIRDESFLSMRKKKATSVGAERLQNPLIRMKATYLFSCIGDFQRILQLHVVIYAQNEGNIRWSWKVAEASHAHEIAIFVQLHKWFSKELTASCGD